MEPKIILVREGLVSSILSDGLTLAILGFLPWANHTFSGGSAWIYAAIAIGWFVSIVSRANNMKAEGTMSPAQARAWLDQHYPVGG